MKVVRAITVSVYRQFRLQLLLLQGPRYRYVARRVLDLCNLPHPVVLHLLLQQAA